MSRSPRSPPPFAQQQAVTTPSPPLVQLDRGEDGAQPPLGAHAVRASAAVRCGCGCESARRVGGQHSGHGRADAQEARATAQVRAHGSMALALPSSPPPSPAAPRPPATSSTSMTGSPSAAPRPTQTPSVATAPARRSSSKPWYVFFFLAQFPISPSPLISSPSHRQGMIQIISCMMQWGRTSSTWFLCPPLIFLNMQGKIYF